MNETSLEILNRTYRESAQELLRHYDIDATSTDVQGSPIELVAAIGFGAEGIAGALALCTTSRCAQYLASAVGSEQEHDWLGELSNQLLGKIKMRLHKHGVTFSIGVPVLLAGEQITVARNIDLSRSTIVSFQTPQGMLEVWFDFKAAPSIELSPEPAQEKSPAEGELLFF